MGLSVIDNMSADEFMAVVIAITVAVWLFTD